MTLPTAKNPPASRAGKKRWFVVEVAAGQADDVKAEVVIMSTHATRPVLIGPEDASRSKPAVT